MIRELWEFYDKRTGDRVSMTTVLTEEQARETVAAWVARDKRGGRPDLHDLIPHVGYRQIRKATP